MIGSGPGPVPGPDANRERDFLLSPKKKDKTRFSQILITPFTKKGFRNSFTRTNENPKDTQGPKKERAPLISQQRVKEIEKGMTQDREKDEIRFHELLEESDIKDINQLFTHDNNQSQVSEVTADNVSDDEEKFALRRGVEVPKLCLPRGSPSPTLSRLLYNQAPEQSSFDSLPTVSAPPTPNPFNNHTPFPADPLNPSSVEILNNNITSPSITTTTTTTATTLTEIDEFVHLRRSSIHLQRFEPSYTSDTSYNLFQTPRGFIQKKESRTRVNLFCIYPPPEDDNEISTGSPPSTPTSSKLPRLLNKQGRRQFYSSLPSNRKIAQLPSRRVARLTPAHEDVVHHDDVVCCRVISTYPKITTEQRAGDPICDYFTVDVLDHQAVFSICDGCNWGEGPREAATRASTAFNSYVTQRLHQIKSLRKAASLILKAFSAAQQAIVDKPLNRLETGTTTLLGGLLLPLAESKSNAKTPAPHLDSEWGLVFASVGDCKAFLWSSQSGLVTDLTRSNRQNALDAVDCGGRLGAYLDGLPDLRNFRLYYQTCSLDDLVFVVSDGVHDNYDPQTLGLSPQDVGLRDADWKDVVVSEEVHTAKTLFRERLIESVINGDGHAVSAGKHGTKKDYSFTPSPKSLIQGLMRHCLEKTHVSREFMEKYPDECLPEDYVKYPGKMDHSAIVCLRVSDRFRNHKNDMHNPFET